MPSACSKLNETRARRCNAWTASASVRARTRSAPSGSSAPSDVDDLDSTPSGSGELLDVAAVGRDDCRAAANG